MAEKLKVSLSGLRTYWDTPPEGYSVPYKEVAGLSIGKFGYYLVLSLIWKIGLSGSNVIIKEAQWSMARCYPDGKPEEPDIQTLDALYDTQPKSRKEAKALRQQIQALEQERLLFYRSTKPYVKAKQLLTDRANAARLDEILEKESLTEELI